MKRTLVLDGERPLSWNELYSGKHWSIRQAKAQRAHALVRAALDPEDPPFERPVNITVTAWFDKQPQDCDNLASKIYIDGLIGWWLVQDSPLYVRSVTTVARIDHAHPRLVIECEEIGPDEPEQLNGCMFACTCGKKYRALKQLLEHRDLGECSGLDSSEV